VLLVCALLVPAAATRADDVTVPMILAAYDRATHSDDMRTFVAEGTVAGEGLSGTFHSWRDGKRERDEDNLGPRHETTLRLGDRIFVRNPNGNVRELRGYLRRRALTEEFLDSGEFVKHPERGRFAGWGNVGGKQVWRLEVTALGGEPETLWIDPASGLPLREEYLDGDGSSFVDYADWRTVQGRTIAFRSTVTDGDHRFDTVEQTTSVTIDGPVDQSLFAPLAARTLGTDRVHTIPLIERDGHVGIKVRIADRDWFFLLDTGAQSILVDSHVLRAAGVDGAGAMEVRGAKRTGGLSVATISDLTIDGAEMRNVVVSSIDIAKSLGGVKIDGILGYPFFASALVEMDFANHVLRFGPPGSFTPRGSRIQLDVDRELAEATLRLHGRVDAPFIVDTGNSGEMFLYQPFLELWARRRERCLPHLARHAAARRDLALQPLGRRRAGETRGVRRPRRRRKRRPGRPTQLRRDVRSRRRGALSPARDQVRRRPLPDRGQNGNKRVVRASSRGATVEAEDRP
jgi:predicted aspartyl protease